MSVSTPIPSTVTCFKNGLSHFTFPVNFRPGLSPNKIGPLTPNTVNGSISVIPDDTNLKIYSITSENNLMIKVHYKLENQDQEGKANFSYISPGIKWTPNYLVKVNDEDKTLTIGGRATIVSSIQFLDDITLPQLSLVSGVPNISCIGESDPLVSNGIEHQRNQRHAPQARMMKSQQNMMFGAAPQAEAAMDSMDDSDEDFDEEKVGELYHFKIKNVPVNFGKATSVPFMDDIMNIPYTNKYSITLDNTKADNKEVMAKHHFKFPMKYAPPLPRGPVMIYLEKENGLTFSSQTHLRTDENMFRLDTTSSNDVNARYTVTTGEKTSEQSVDDSTKKVKAAENRILYTTSKIASIVIKNKKKEETDVHLEVTIYGTVCTKDLEKDVIKVIEKPNTNDLNPENVIKCDLKVAANETKEFGFTYGVKKWEVQTLANVSTMSNSSFGGSGVPSQGAFGFK